MSRVLFVEDDPVAAKLLSRLLEKAGHTVDHVKNGLEAVDLMAQGDDYDAIVTDMMMARMDGEELCRWVRDLPGCEQLPIIMTTGRADLQSAPWIEELGVDLLEKPIKVPDLLARIGG